MDEIEVNKLIERVVFLVEVDSDVKVSDEVKQNAREYLLNKYKKKRVINDLVQELLDKYKTI